MTKNNNHPEGIQITMEILDNIPEELLKDFCEKTIELPEKPIQDIWKEVVNNWFDK